MIKANLDRHENLSDKNQIKNVLAKGGLVSKTLSNFEQRPEQIEMACVVQQSFDKCRHLAVEAGTGVGKSFAYLVPAIQHVTSNKNKILISTYTITLQEQLISKDIPFLANCMEENFSAVLAKGRNNYLCKRRLNFATKQRKIFDDLADELETIRDWANHTKDGSLSDLGFWPSSQAWDKVKSEHGNCPGRKCTHFSDCFYRCARRKIDKADIIITNHALLFSDLIL
jgi:ATP-dependent DNA helicase DinG